MSYGGGPTISPPYAQFPSFLKKVMVEGIQKSVYMPKQIFSWKYIEIIFMSSTIFQTYLDKYAFLYHR